MRSSCCASLGYVKSLDKQPWLSVLARNTFFADRHLAALCHRFRFEPRPTAQSSVACGGCCFGWRGGRPGEARARSFDGERRVFNDPRYQPVHADMQVEFLHDQIHPIIRCPQPAKLLWRCTLEGRNEARFGAKNPSVRELQHYRATLSIEPGLLRMVLPRGGVFLQADGPIEYVLGDRHSVWKRPGRAERGMAALRGRKGNADIRTMLPHQQMRGGPSHHTLAISSCSGSRHVGAPCAEASARTLRSANRHTPIA